VKYIQRFALVLAGLLLALCWSAGVASANTGPHDSPFDLQHQDQSNRNQTDQDAHSKAAAVQVGGVNAPISVLNLGESSQGGQSNSAVNSASSSNENGTGQANVGSQKSGLAWAPVVQVQDQSNRNQTDQDAHSKAAAVQVGGVNAPISVANLGCLQQGGQSNAAVNTASTTNQNHTLQLNGMGQMLR
jgi:hypothetical protein